MVRQAVGARGLAAALIAVAVIGCKDDPAAPPGVRFEEEIYSVTSHRDVQYGSAVDEYGQTEALLLDLWLPMGDPGMHRPGIVWIHGGNLVEGNKELMADYAQSFASRGYVSVNINYRLREGETFDYQDVNDPLVREALQDAQHDAQAAVRWLRKNAEPLGLDETEITVAGYSAGAVTALRAAFRPDDPGNSGNPAFSSTVSAAMALAGMIPESEIGSGTPSVLMLHGAEDTKILPETARATCDAILARSLNCELVLFPGRDHHDLNDDRTLLKDAMGIFLTETYGL